MAASTIPEILAEMLLSGEVSLDDDLGELAGVFTLLRAMAINDPDADYSHLIRMAAAERRLTPLDEYARVSSSNNGHPHHRVLTRLTMAGAALALVVTMSGGLAYAANGAKPGDLLYALDRALEGIGIGDGGVAERLSESIALAQTDADADPDADTLPVALAAPAPTSSNDPTVERPPAESGDVAAPWLLPDPTEHPRETQFPGVPDKASKATDAADGESGDTADDSSIGGSTGPPDDPRSNPPDPAAAEERGDGSDNTESPPVDDATGWADDGPTDPPEPADDPIGETKPTWDEHPGITNHARQALAACYQGKMDKAHAKLAKYWTEIYKMEAGGKLSAETAHRMRLYGHTLQTLFENPEAGCLPQS